MIYHVKTNLVIENYLFGTYLHYYRDISINLTQKCIYFKL